MAKRLVFHVTEHKQDGKWKVMEEEAIMNRLRGLILGTALLSLVQMPQALCAQSQQSIADARAASQRWSAQHRSAGDLTPAELRQALASFGGGAIGKDSTAFTWMEGPNDELWRTKNHIFGFFGPGAGTDPIPLQNAFSQMPDSSLRGQYIRITLDRIKVQRYPGKGTHNIAFSFHGQTQTGDDLVPLSYTLGVTARAGDEPGLVGKSLFVGLGVGNEGVDFKGSTVNVNTEKDKTFFSILAGNVLAQGLRLLPTAQPALRPLTELAEGVSRELGDLNKGIPVQVFDIGLDLSSVPSHIHLREGAYVVLQIPPKAAELWRWEDWQFANGRIERKTDKRTVPYNYMIFGVSRF